MSRIRARLKPKLMATDALTPIARWDIVPYQRVTGTFAAGVVAFSKNGVTKVGVSVNGGTETTATTMTLNARTGIVEYNVPIDCSAYPDGMITVDGVVYEPGGGTNVLPTVTLVNNNGGTVVRYEAWVDDTTGDDSTGLVGDSGLPFASIAKASHALSTQSNTDGNGYNPWGSIIYLEEGTHSINRFAVSGTYDYIPSDQAFVTDEWCIVKPAAGALKVNTVVSSGTPNISNLKLEGVTVAWDATDTDSRALIKSLQATDFLIGYPETYRASFWLDDVDLTGIDKTTLQAITWDGVGAWYTNSDISNIRNGTSEGCRMIRGCTISEIGEDVFRNTEMVLDCDVDHSGPGLNPDEVHSDVWQYYMSSRPWENIIIYGLRAKEIFVTAMDVDVTGGTGIECNGVAIVNTLWQMATVGSPNQGGFWFWKVPVSHFLIWNNTLEVENGFDNVDMLLLRFTRFYDGPGWGFRDLSIKGNSMWSLVTSDITGSGYAMTYTNCEIDENNFRTTYANDSTLRLTETNTTVVDPNLDANMVPQAGSSLLARVTPLLVPVDGNNVVRGDPADVGAFEYIP